MRAKLHWWRYYYVTRRLQRFLPWLAHRLPRRLKYWVVIDAMAYHTVVVDPHCHPDEVKGWDLLRAMDDPKMSKEHDDRYLKMSACQRFHPDEECKLGSNHPVSGSGCA